MNMKDDVVDESIPVVARHGDDSDQILELSSAADSAHHTHSPGVSEDSLEFHQQSSASKKNKPPRLKTDHDSPPQDDEHDTGQDDEEQQPEDENDDDDDDDPAKPKRSSTKSDSAASNSAAAQAAKKPPKKKGVWKKPAVSIKAICYVLFPRSIVGISKVVRDILTFLLSCFSFDISRSLSGSHDTHCISFTMNKHQHQRKRQQGMPKRPLS
jgi:hypothetical protein